MNTIGQHKEQFLSLLEAHNTVELSRFFDSPPILVVGEFASENQEDSKVPEIQTNELATIVLQLKAMGINDITSDIDLITPPSKESVEKALRDLVGFQAINSLEDPSLTPIGKAMAGFPLDQCYSRMIVQAEQLGCTDDILTIISTADQELFTSPINAEFIVKDSDHLTLLNVYNSFAANQFSSEWCDKHQINFKSMERCKKIREQLLTLMNKYSIKLVSSLPNGVDNIKKSIQSGLHMNVAQLQSDGSYQTIAKDKSLFLHPSSVLASLESPPQCVVFTTISADPATEPNKQFMKLNTVVDSNCL
ncbi:hypothetical protein DICPUDRAFT_96887 [Dictyostelium purpureum]|uniref:Helicase-associated domain-containing protein n=1 Tax=Dictyostelium purpureum TaxID=5786 RepID=F0ZC27_DICPU|nr:uncharacterized protein DICPUDRAFT_96887 [Dictyostelium purpureum]EGC38499.1 hypothetical protein DICPUDRAFT_96887 [Dictyostelium purpureum]|eukprot:XP_003284964.1 hypothetical protein DICPUDRAFT_96887 [Dictyostelium purpureum]